MINEFDFKIKYIKGRDNRVADALSEQIHVNHLEAMSSYGMNLHDRILQASQQYVRFMEILHRFRDKIYVLDNNELTKVILREFHAKPYSGNPGYQNTLTTVNKFYYWLNLKSGVAVFMARCFDCQRVKAECKNPGRLLKPIAIPEWKWEVISMDFITGLPKTMTKHDSITVIVDRLTKASQLIPMKSTFSTSDITQVFTRDVVRLHGVPKNIVSQRDAKLTSKFWKEL
eukprot:PITA_27558